MVLVQNLRAVVLLALSLVSVTSATSLDYLQSCYEVAGSLSPSSHVYFVGHPSYEAGIEHWSALSTQQSACVVEPGTPEDVAAVLQIVGKRRTPFAVKGGGHAANPGTSSTEGVHISTTKFSNVRYEATSGVVEFGAGLVWDDVYTALERYNVTVVGGRSSGVGVAGFTLGGGYSWLTNQHGLTVDTVVAYELVLPTGEVKIVDEKSDSELFFGLKGGMNNFGIVTRFFLKTFPQTQVWGGLVIYFMGEIDVYSKISEAVLAFEANVHDPKAGLLVTYTVHQGFPLVSLGLFYDGPTPPSGIFEGFIGVAPAQTYVTNVATRSLAELTKALTSEAFHGKRNNFHTASVVGHGPNLLKAVVNETLFWKDALPSPHTRYFGYTVEPFLRTIYTHGEASSAFPHTRTAPISPLNVMFSWVNPEEDEVSFNAIRESLTRIEAAAAADGDVNAAEAPLYPNYAVIGTQQERIYGDHLPALVALRKRVDPWNIMGLAGGFKVSC